MAVKVNDSGGGDFRLMPEGTHLAVCNMVVDLGQQESFYGIKHQVFLRWETPHERTDDDRPMVIGKIYTASLNEKANLRKDLENWRGRAFTEDELQEFDLDKVLGNPCQVTIQHRTKGDRTFANVTGVTALAKGMEAPEAENDLIVYDPESNQDWEKLPEWIQEKVKNQSNVPVVDSDEYDEANPPPPDPDDTPF